MWQLKHYDEANYNCMHFVADVHKELTGCDIFDAVHTLCRTQTERSIKRSQLARFQPQTTPTENSIVSMRHSTGLHHVGIYHQNHVMHLTHSGMQFVPLHIIREQYQTVRFYLYE